MKGHIISTQYNSLPMYIALQCVFVCVYVCRSWRYDRASDCYIVVATSVTHPLANLLAGIRSIQMASDYVIEPLDENNCRVTHLCRVDMR